MNITFEPPQPLGLDGKRVAVLGLARTGIAAVEALCQRGAFVAGCDSKALADLGDAPARLDAVGACLVDHCQVFEQIGGPGAVDLIVVSPGIPVDHAILREARSHGVRIIGEIELAYRLLRCPIIAVTGTNGKGTTCTVLGDMLDRAGMRVAVAGNIGTPLVSYADTPLDAIVAEISSFQFETVELFRPAISVLLNITPDHLSDRHGDFDAYVAAKRRMFVNQTDRDFAILNIDDPVVASLAGAIPASVLTVSLGGSATGRLEGDLLVVETEATGRLEVCSASDIPVPGEHNRRNFLCAALAAALCGASALSMREAIAAFKPALHLLTPVGEARGVHFLDDSKATNPASAIADLSALSGEVIVISGGKDKGSDFRDLGDAIAAHAKAAFLIGETKHRIAAAIGGRVPMNLCANLEQAVREAFATASPGATVVLLPACSSFDMFADYAARGDAFADLARQIAREAALMPGSGALKL
jgi:UDP-N-acetylmuramoylalanine--D-glutamate ligase